MLKSKPKIYFSENRALMLELCGNGQAVNINNVMPPQLTLEALDREKFEYFWQFTFPFWLVDDKYLAKIEGGTRANPNQIKWQDHIDLQHYGLVNDNQIIEDQLLYIVSVIAKYWDYKPQAGLLFELFKAGTSKQATSDILAQLADPKTRTFDFTRLSALKDEVKAKFINTTNMSRQQRRLMQRKK